MNNLQAINITNDPTFQAILKYTPFVYNFPVSDTDFPCKRHLESTGHPLLWELIQVLADKYDVTDASVDALYHDTITCTCSFVVEDAYYV